MNVRIFLVCAMKCMCAQTRPRFILSSERVLGGNGVWTHVNSKGKIPSTGKFPQRRIKPATLWTASQNTTTSYSGPHDYDDNHHYYCCQGDNRGTAGPQRSSQTTSTRTTGHRGKIALMLLGRSRPSVNLVHSVWQRIMPLFAFVYSCRFCLPVNFIHSFCH